MEEEKRAEGGVKVPAGDPEGSLFEQVLFLRVSG